MGPGHCQLCQKSLLLNAATHHMRSKEHAHDYRYFPDPDLMPIVLDDAYVDAVRAEVPELPAARRARYIGDFGLPEYDAGLLVGDKAVAAFFEATVGLGADPKTASNWIMTEVLREVNERGVGLNDLSITPEGLAGIWRDWMSKRRASTPVEVATEAPFPSERG